MGEEIEQAALRETCEETTLKVKLMALLGVYSDPQRDMRGHMASVVYIAQAQGLLHAQDDAADVGLFSPQRLPENLAFDQRLILADYLVFRQTGHLPLPRVRPTTVPHVADKE